MTPAHGSFKELDAARKKYALEPNADSLETIRIALNRNVKLLTKMDRQPEAVALQKEAAATAEGAVGKHPDAPTYRVAIDILVSYADSIRASDPGHRPPRLHARQRTGGTTPRRQRRGPRPPRPCLRAHRRSGRR